MPLNDPIQQALRDPASSFWLKSALSSALERDPLDAASDAQALASLLVQHAEGMMAASLAAMAIDSTKR